ncbi:Multiple coagulation factor deficiency protein 2 -like protein [Toxocara canis]|uniref:Multiple coagulation factor deficiency protein 2-like protein n=1 Tax=Toxocara canis TaxID=6265 RepID=A0A0B2VCU6_TOXCA|nr:Multiple coagulation factor deficiency protein 2 -like protein [Toxocara canis]
MRTVRTVYITIVFRPYYSCSACSSYIGIFLEYGSDWIQVFDMKWILCTLLSTIVIAHQQPQFPGHNAQQPPEVHHQNQQYKQPAPAQPNTPHVQTQEFGGQQAQDAEHIKEHLDGKVDPTANMTPEQLQFHYFNMHDLDKNGKLDGIELIKAITHFHQENPGPAHQGSNVPPPLPSEVELEQMIDSILREDDFDGDGYIDYGEFLKAQKQREEQARSQQQRQQQPPPPPR